MIEPLRRCSRGDHDGVGLIPDVIGDLLSLVEALIVRWSRLESHFRIVSLLHDMLHGPTVVGESSAVVRELVDALLSHDASESLAVVSLGGN